MPGHDHNLRKLYSIESLVTPDMVYNWICPVRPEESCPVDALSHVFSEYLRRITKINMQEDFLNFGFAAPLFTESDWTGQKHQLKKLHL